MSNDAETKENVREDVYNEELLDKLLDENDIDQFRDEFLSMHNYEQSEYFEDTDDNKRQKNIWVFISERSSKFLRSIRYWRWRLRRPFDKINATYASHVLEEMSYDNSVDILNELSKSKVASLLTLMDKDEANEIKALLHYEEDTAGGIMTTEVYFS